jgi:crotonobetainyl-CoA:carnitine CoA-transferase CaiB-like acyl-CoA transferase
VRPISRAIRASPTTHRAALVESITRLTASLKAADLLETLRAAGVPSAPILRIDQVLDEPQTHASGMVTAAPHPRIADYRSIALPLLWNGARPGVRRVPPKLGEHDADVLTWLGYTLDDIRSLRQQKVLA